MVIDCHATKDATNRVKHGISLWRLAEMVEATIIALPARTVDGEARTMLYGMLDERLHQAIITMRGDTTRPISLRRANAREQRKYAEAIT